MCKEGNAKEDEADSVGARKDLPLLAMSSERRTRVGSIENTKHSPARGQPWRTQFCKANRRSSRPAIHAIAHVCR